MCIYWDNYTNINIALLLIMNEHFKSPNKKMHPTNKAPYGYTPKDIN